MARQNTNGSTLNSSGKQQPVGDELQQLNEELKQKVQQLTTDLTNILAREKELNDLKSRFVSMASHEFRTPLTNVLVSTGLLETHIQRRDDEKCAKHIARIKSSVQTLTEILEDFLSLNKLEQGQVRPFVTVIDLEEFADEISNELAPTLKKGQCIIYSVKGTISVKQDVNMLKNIMLNLLSNASKYSAEEQAIKWGITVQNDKIIMAVTDSGIGIPVKDQPHIFSRFFRAKNVETLQGTGLGLNIAKKYAELINGKISFVSTENAGTTFTVEVPVLQ